MRYTLKEAFTSLFSHVKFDKDLAKQIYLFRVAYMTANREHMEFFGGNLLGVNIVRFKDSDVNRFCELFELPYSEIVSEVRQVTTIDHAFKVGSDVFNLMIMYLIHRFLNSNIAIQDKQKACHDLALVFFCRCAAALISANFKYPADPKVAQLAYANLSQKYLIKRLGSWNKVMEYRANALMNTKESPHTKTLMHFEEDTKVQYAVTDSQGRIREMFKGYYSEFMLVHESGGSLASQSAKVLDAEGEEALRERTTGPETYVFYIRDIVSDLDTFVRDDLLQIVARNNSNTSLRAVRSVLEWLSSHAADPKNVKLVDDFLSRTLVQMAHFLQYNIEPSRHRDLNYVMTNLKNLFLSTRSVDPDLANIRDLGEKIIIQSEGKLSTSLMMATRTAVIMYICLRAMVGNKK